MKHEVLHGDCLDILRTLPENSLDSMVTDPPAGIGFMGKDWDRDKGGRTEWVRWLTGIMNEAYRVLKPGAHGLVWALPRTSHWTAWALEEAGFELRDCVYHVFGSGFPKSADISKQLDKMAGAEREVVGVKQSPYTPTGRNTNCYGEYNIPTDDRGYLQYDITAPATPAARQWSGWGTALKPAVECWWLVRKPISEKNIAANVVRWGTGGLNIERCRIETSETLGRPNCQGVGAYSNFHVNQKSRPDSSSWKGNLSEFKQPSGRFPAHLIHDGSPEVVAGFPVTGGGGASTTQNDCTFFVGKKGRPDHKGRITEPGSAARFFYVAKPSRSERNRGLEGLPERITKRYSEQGQGPTPQQTPRQHKPETNHHPTVKPVALMRYLCRLITPPGGTVLDLFTGSGTTGIGAKLEGFNFLGIEKEAEYVEIARARIAAWEPEPEQEDNQLTIF